MPASLIMENDTPALPTETRQIPVPVLLPQSTITRLETEVKRRGLRSRSQLIRLACDAFLGEQPAV